MPSKLGRPWVKTGGYEYMAVFPLTVLEYLNSLSTAESVTSENLKAGLIWENETWTQQSHHVEYVIYPDTLT